jgi:hypothetical protein
MGGRLIKNRGALLLLAAWLPLIVLAYPVPTQSGAEQIMCAASQFVEKNTGEREPTKRHEKLERLTTELVEPNNIRAFWVTSLLRWSLFCLSLVAGLVACVTAIFTVRGWRFVMILAALFYLITSAWQPWMLLPTEANMLLWRAFIKNLPNGLLYTYKGLVFPIIQAVVVVTLCVGFLRRRKQHAA